MASKRRIRRKECIRKRRHETKEAARDALLRLVNGGRARGGMLATYRCPWCSGWHVGHNGKPAPVQRPVP